MNILIANDDGINAEGIRALIDVLKDDNNLYVVAPDTQKSASSHWITYFNTEHKAIRTDIDGVKAAWAIEGGTPADCTYYGLSTLIKEKIDLVISGINQGENLSADCMYSGTVAAALEGYIAGIPSIATSYCSYTEKNFGVTAEIVKEFIPHLMNDKNNKNYCLNLNVPNLSKEEIKGYKVCGFGGNQIYENIVNKKELDNGDILLYPDISFGNKAILSKQIDSDILAIREGYVALTPLFLDFVNYEMINEIKDYEKIEIGG